MHHKGKIPFTQEGLSKASEDAPGHYQPLIQLEAWVQQHPQDMNPFL